MVQATLVVVVAACDRVSVSVAVPPLPGPPSLTRTSPIDTRGTPLKAGSFVRVVNASTEVWPPRDITPIRPSVTGAKKELLTAKVSLTETLTEVPLSVRPRV